MMANGITQKENGFAVRDFRTDEEVFEIGKIQFPSYEDAVKACCGRYYPVSYYQYLIQAEKFEKKPDADVWENMIYAEDPRGIWDGENGTYRNVSSMDRGAATEEEIAYVDALDATYKSLTAMVLK